ncbi:hypothetical protein B0O80DRAFT_471742 [Mortierella sp. GBAus27b]|nr:hypothetical protein BGX31_011044 [Mortierella sp. GBA43]KAI8345762.1 hypothetical protein B0O80DRAFT_471742 [Mortierella sp. GBAus27b]
MLFTTSAPLYVAILAVLTFLAVTPGTAQADCPFDCTGIGAKILFCGGIGSKLQDDFPVIGIDSKLDKCMCTQENVRLFRDCYGCKEPNNVKNKTDKFISDCKIQDSSRVLINGASTHKGSFSNTATLITAVASLCIVAAIGF